METNYENAIEFLTGQKNATLSLTNRKYINKLKRLYEKNQSDFEYFTENLDGSVCCKVPLSWIKISPPKKISDEMKQAASERFKKLREEGKLIKGQ